MQRTINEKGETVWVDDNGEPVTAPAGGARSAPRPPAPGAEVVRPAAPVAARQGPAPRQTAPPGMQLVHTPDGLRARDLATLATIRLDHVPAFEAARAAGELPDVIGGAWEPGQEAVEALPLAAAPEATPEAAPAPAVPAVPGFTVDAVAALLDERLAPLLARLAALEEALARPRGGRGRPNPPAPPEPPAETPEQPPTPTAPPTA